MGKRGQVKGREKGGGLRMGNFGKSYVGKRERVKDGKMGGLRMGKRERVKGGKKEWVKGGKRV